MEELIRYMRAMVMLQLHTAQGMAAGDGGHPLKPEVLLADAGFNTRDIATMLDKSPAAVAKAISRARSARRTGDGGAGLNNPTTGGAMNNG